METIANEEQMNYFWNFKTNIGKLDIKNGVSDLLSGQKPNYSKDNTNLEILVDVTLIRAECEKFRKDLKKGLKSSS